MNQKIKWGSGDQGMWDTGDLIRARHWDMYKPDGSPDDRLDSLLGALGAYGGDPAWQAAQLRRWAASTASIPAPRKLKRAVEDFLREYDRKAKTAAAEDSARLASDRLEG